MKGEPNASSIMIILCFAFHRAGSSVLAAFVEIIFDNSDDRFSTGTDDVVLRRTVGLKKDEFFLNKKRMPKEDIVSLLETAGFSRTNPYYIVQQGKVANLCTMKDKDRLVLLKEVSGTSVYEEKRSESLKILQESGVQQDRINVSIPALICAIGPAYYV